ncbi:nuclear transcription factor Y subunit beta [Cryptococcus floricola]|uniref:Nuclear transcription factor Y subunit beta n=1 Tax=Cryptococcus floricola TaxID=2591691 RepID=A0A5D3AQD0_9TREE|nr:nuclear transcription factor Y subunit beta [Cryptococcus floricola]
MADSTPLPKIPIIAPVGTNHDEASTSGAGPPKPFTEAQVEEFREQDRWLPIANVARIMKSSLPSSAKVSKEAKECVQECVSEFISFITSEAAEKCLNEKRKTLNGEDILTSMRALGFDNYEGVLRVYLAKYRDSHHSIPKRHQHHDDDGDDHDHAGPKKRGRGRASGAAGGTNGEGKGKRRKGDDGK